MKIKETNTTNYFREVNNGDVFFADGCYYLKMDSFIYEDEYTHERAVNAVNLESGKPTYFGQDENVVIEKKAELVIS